MKEKCSYMVSPDLDRSPWEILNHMLGAWRNQIFSKAFNLWVRPFPYWTQLYVCTGIVHESSMDIRSLRQLILSTHNWEKPLEEHFPVQLDHVLALSRVIYDHFWTTYTTELLKPVLNSQYNYEGSRFRESKL